MTVRSIHASPCFSVLLLLFWLCPSPTLAQQIENDLECIEGAGAIPINYGDNTSGCAVDTPTDRDLFILSNGAAGTSIRFNVLGATPGLDPRIEVLDPTGAVVTDTSCSSTSSISGCSFSADLDLSVTGEYVIAISDVGTNETGDYQMTLNCIVGSCPGAPALVSIAYDVAVLDTLTPAVDMDFFTFQGAADTSIRFNVLGATPGLDPRIEIRDPAGAVAIDMACSSTSSISGCSFSADVDLLLTGTYQVAVSDLGTNEPGDYEIRLNCVFGSSCLVVAPDEDFHLSGPVGGPFTTIKDYTLTNNGVLTVDFTASATENFVSLSQTGGSLGGQASTAVTVSVNGNAASLPPGEHVATVDFVNTTNGQGSTARAVKLTVTCPASLEVTPAAAFQSQGPMGGPFEPESKIYTVRNPLVDVGGTLCGSDLEFSVATVGDFLDVSTTSGTLEPDGKTTVTVSLNSAANSLEAGSYNGSIEFVDTANNLGDIDLGATLTVGEGEEPPPMPSWLAPILHLLMGSDELEEEEP